jgi:cytoskeletal protein RodZ
MGTVVLTIIQYRTSKNGLTNYSGWKDAQFNDLTANEIEGIATGDFADGDQNYIQWRINDRAGNSIETVDYRINIDLTELEFSNPSPIFDVDPQTWSQTQSVLCSVKLDDSATGSGVDATSISFRYSTTGTADAAFNNWTSLGLTASKNAENIIVSKNITFDYGDQNYIQWRAKDVAGNGWTESPKYQIKVTPLDSDGDSMPDSWEELFDLDPNDASDANDDDDNDGLTNLQEYELIKTYSDYTRPDKADTDGDGALDGEEVEAGTNPLDENDVPEKRTDKPDDRGDNYLWLIILIVIIIIVVLLIVFFLMRKKREEEPEEAEEEERPEGEEYPEDEAEEEDLDEWKFEDEVEAPVAEPEEMAAEEEEDFIDIDLKESSKPMKGKMPAEKKGKKPGVVRHGKPKKGKLPEKGKMPKKGKAPKKEIEPEIEPEEEFADDEMAGELAAAEAEPSEPFLVKLDESATCNICLGAIKTGLPVVKCTCGKKYHDSCAARVGECPNCDTDISNPISKLDEEDDEITAEDLDAIDDEE